MDILKFLVTINGAAHLWADNGHFLGQLSSDQDNRQSIINPHTYGSSYSYSSIQNPNSPYGGISGLYSPYNPNCINPPIVVYQSERVLVVTRNTCLQTKGLPIVDPDLMLGMYIRYAIAKPEPAVMHLEAVKQALQAESPLMALIDK